MPCNTLFRACLLGAALVGATGATITGAGRAELTFDYYVVRGQGTEDTQDIRVKQVGGG